MLKLSSSFLLFILVNIPYQAFSQEWNYHKTEAGKYIAKNDFKKAIEHYDKALKFKPDLTFALKMRAACKIFTNDNKGALIDYNKLIEGDSNNNEYYFNRAICKINLKMFKSACLDFNKAKALGHEGAIERIKKHCKY
jgi:tetratricopeptide (TPR) repeat protein